MAKYQFYFNKEKCKGCEMCVIVCPKNLIVMDKVVNNKGYYTANINNVEECIGCTNCALMCPDCCIEIYKNEEE